MRKRIALIVLTSLISTSVFAGPLVSQLKEMAKANDDLGMRVALRKSFKTKISLSDWEEINKLINQRPNVGFDIVIAWYRQATIKDTLNKPGNKLVQDTLNAADDLMLKNDFLGAFEKYQLAAQTIKKQNNKVIKRVHLQLYFNILHQMGRALYGAKKYDEAMEVYDWISPTYFQSRQIMFEKMWTAFRSQKLDRALGAVASQQSAYYSKYLDPESYLIKIYILKKLCRENELKLTISSIKQYLGQLKANKVPTIEWAKNDLLRMSLANLLQKGLSKDQFGISRAERISEKRKIKTYLDSKFRTDKVRLIASLEKVLGYAVMAATTEQKALAKTTDLPSSPELEKNGYEYWPGSYEEWVDEVGSHIFVGDSQCVVK